ncbi:MAG: multidrug transporter, partial [Gammaproteobacteria bacterium]
VLAMTEALRQWAAQKQGDLPPGVELVVWSDRSVILNGRINLMLKSAVQGAILVVLTLALFLDLSLAFWVILGVPFAFLGSLLAIYALDLAVSINVISVFGFILVLGMLVDDGIVTAESAYVHLERERDGVGSIVRGVKRVTVATVFGVATTIVAFLPALYLETGMARFMPQIVSVVAFCLLFSLLETKLILPAHLRHIKIAPPRDDNSLKSRFLRVQRRCANGFQGFARHRYQPLLKKAVRNRYLTVALFIGGLLICLALVPSGIVRMVFLPNVPSDNIFINLTMPQGTPWQTTHEYSLRIEDAIRAVDERYAKEMGSSEGVVKEIMTYSTNDTESLVLTELIPSEQRSVSSVQLAQWIREAVGELSGVQSLTFNANAGSGGAPIDVQLQGENLAQMRAAAEELKRAIADFDGVSDVRDSFDAGGPELDIQLTEQGDAMGLGQVDLARQVRQAFFGAEVQRVQRGRHEVRVYVRLPLADRESLAALRSLWISTPSGERVPFDVVGRAVEYSGVSVIQRVDRQRVVNVRADVNKAVAEPGEINRVLRSELVPEILAKYPSVSFSLSGEAEEQAEITDTLKWGFIAIMLMIYTTLAIPLKSYTQPL